jgi:hypothetical protein
MELPSSCQSCRGVPSASLLAYRKGSEVVSHETLLQCDMCDRFACAECLQVYEILSGYDFVCHDCAQQLLPKPGERGH